MGCSGNSRRLFSSGLLRPGRFYVPAPFCTLGPLPHDTSDQNRHCSRLWSQEPAWKVPLSGPSWGTYRLPGLRGPVNSTQGQHPLGPSPHHGQTTWHLEKGSQVKSLCGSQAVPRFLSGFPPFPNTIFLLESFSKAWPRGYLLYEAFLDFSLPCQSELVTPFLMLPLPWFLVGGSLWEVTCPTRLSAP